ncbi:MAG: type I-D CRISPR-associated protein Cas10d/Csc3, partial [Firmicutes bacterium]|nr:type I-D CRISPR-associated protein Cas10d/Csc3 [Bacillota bacterium]
MHSDNGILDFGSLDFEDQQQVELSEDRRIPPIAKLIFDSATEDHPVLRQWIDTVVPHLLGNLGLKNAKGMSEREARLFVSTDLNPEAREKAVATLTSMPDQSLAVHTINAALGAWTIVDLAGLDDESRRLYLAGVTMHDLNKMIEREIRLQGKQAEDYEHALREWGRKLGLWDFIDQRYWPDVAFLAQNAEAKRGENRTLANYPNLQKDPASLEDLAEFVRLADLLASVAQRPDDLMHMSGPNRPTDIIRRVLDDQYVLRYHRTAENRGLLTQVIHNAVLDQTTAQEWIPFLFFPDGITYLAPKDAPEPDLDTLPIAVRETLMETIKDSMGTLVSRNQFGTRYPQELVEILDEFSAARIIVSRTMTLISDNKDPVTENRKEKTELKPDSQVELDLDYPASLNADRLAEGMIALTNLIEDYFGGSKDDHGEALVRALGMEAHIEAWQSIARTGGIGYHWYYVGGHYAKKHPGLAAEELAEAMMAAYEEVLKELDPPSRLPPFAFLEEYIPQILSLGGTYQDWDFAAELKQYQQSKALRSGQRICAICHSPFEN